ncbi:MAG: hypothetical protein Q8L66_16295 [Caulobacter sp.]|nr:hypothetical protein [Caulobacter sp.]
MKTSIASLALVGAVLIAGAAVAQGADPGGPGKDSPAPAETRGGAPANAPAGGALRASAPTPAGDPAPAADWGFSTGDFTGPTATAGKGPAADTGAGQSYTTGDFTSPQLQRAPDPYSYIKIDAALSARACTARHGAVVRRDGVQQCRLPAAR